MKIKYFPDTDTLLIEFSNREVHETREISENIYVDLNEAGDIVSMTIEHAKSSTPGEWEFSYQEMAAEAA